ncbi:MAG: nuclear transport factor 2 family protein [Actinomycetota bacterium]
MSEVNIELIRRFYEAFDRHDGETMAACYATDAHFRDPAFGDLQGAEVGSMWRMLTSGAEELDVELHEHEADERTGSAHWIAHYTFTQTGRKVTNDIRATFAFEGGLITDHVDEFDFGRWARQALGPMGWAITVLPPLRNAVRKRARGNLDEFMAGEGDSPGQ